MHRLFVGLLEARNGQLRRISSVWLCNSVEDA